MNKAIEDFWTSYKDAKKERGFGKLVPQLKKKDLEHMSLHDIFEGMIDKITGKDVVFDKPLGTISDEEWDEMNDRLEKRAQKLYRAMGFDLSEKEDTPPIYGEEQNN